MSWVRSALSYANVMATVAVFLALGGGAYAAVKLPRNSVGTRQIKNDAVVSSKVKNGSLQKADFGAGQLPAGPTGPQGPKGDAGPPGPKGDAGSQASVGSRVVARLRSTGSVSTASGETEVPLSGNSWTQGAQEIDRFSGTMTVEKPSSCGNFGGLLITPVVDGVPGNTFPFGLFEMGASNTFPIGDQDLFEPGVDTPRDIAIRVDDNCGDAGEDFKVTDVKVDVEGVR